MSRANLVFRTGNSLVAPGYVSGLGALGLDFNANLTPNAQQEAQTYGAQTSYNAANPNQLPPMDTSGGGGFSILGLVSSFIGIGKNANSGPNAFTQAQAAFYQQNSVLPIVLGIGGFLVAVGGLVYFLKKK